MHCTIISKALRSKTVKVQSASLDTLVEQFKALKGRTARVPQLREELLALTQGSTPPAFDQLPQLQPAYRQVRPRGGTPYAVYQGVVLLSVNDIENQQTMRQLKDEACMLPSTLMAVEGCSGRTLKLLVVTCLDNGPLPDSHEDIARFHRAVAQRAQKVYGAILSLPLEQREPQPDDVMHWTFDPDLRYNPDAAPLRLARRELRGAAGIEAIASQPYAGTQPTEYNYRINARKFTTAVDLARQSQPDADSDEAFIQLVAGRCIELGIPQEEAVRLASASWRWPSLDNDMKRTLIEAVYAETRNRHNRHRGLMQDATMRLQEFMSLRYDLRFNELTNGVEYRPNHSLATRFHPLDSRMENTMIQEANETGLEIMDRDMHRYLGSTRIRSYNAVRAYLDEHANDWDGATDYIGQLAERVPTSNPNWKQWFHTWLLAVVAQWTERDRRHGNAIVPLLIGPQGCGKSTFGQVLLPPELRSEGYRELVSFTNKEEVQRNLTSALLINLDEFNQIGERTQQGFLKNLLQKATFKGRRPYSSVQVELPRRASFIATSNFADVLTDPSGSRRFIVATINGTDTIDTSTPIPYGKLYSQAIQELDQGRRYYFTPQEQTEIEAYNSAQTDQRPEITNFLETFATATVEDHTTRRLSVAQLALAVTASTGFRYDNRGRMLLGRYLAQEARRLHTRKSVSAGYPQYLVVPRE